MTDFETAELWELTYELSPFNVESCLKIDPYLADRIECLKDLLQVFYYLCYGKIQNNLPETKKKVNQLFREELKNEDVNWYNFKRFRDWFDDDIKCELVKTWLGDDKHNAQSSWVVDTFTVGELRDGDMGLKVIDKLTKLYKKNKSRKNVTLIENLFKSLDSRFVNDACEIVSKSTPAVAASLLRRTDISEKYTIKGLKALSKLSKQRNVDIKIDFDMLKHLGPKGRLDAMKQLMGMFDKYFKWQQENLPNAATYYDKYYYNRRKPKEVTYELPFKKMPEREDIEIFLFPCSLKYNSEVVAMMKRYNDIVGSLKTEEASDGECV